MTYSKNYILSPVVTFIVIGFVLLIGIIIGHDGINRGFKLSNIIKKTIPISMAKTSSSIPDYVVNGVTNSGINITGVTESCDSRPSAVSRLICQDNQKNKPVTFITQN